MVRSVPLKKLPTDLEFPADLQSKISFDAARGELSFRGFMSKVEFDRLLRLSNDLEYQRKLEVLFRLCVFQTNTPPPTKSWAATAIASMAALAAIAGLSLLLLNLRH